MFKLYTRSQPNSIFSHQISNVLYSRGVHLRNTPLVLILHSGILLDDLLTSLLWCEPGIQISITRMDHEEVIAQEIVLENPQTVILCKTFWFSVDKLNQWLEDLHYSETIQIFAVSLDENSLVVSNNKKLVATNFKGLVNLVKTNGFAS